MVQSRATLLRAASRRLRFLAVGRVFYRAFLVTAVVALVAILISRLLSLLPAGWITLATLPLWLGAPALAALLLARRPSTAETARALDTRAQTHDLFLSASLLDRQSGGYQSLVEEEADRAAARLDASRLIPLPWLAPARHLAVAALVLVATVYWTPRLDPFRWQEKRDEITKQETRLLETKKITAERKEELAAKSEPLKASVDQALAKLNQTLKEAKRDQPKLNAQKLAEEAQQFSNLWKQAGAQVPKDSLEKAAQQFGATAEQKETQAMLEQLKKGDSQALQKAMEKLSQQMAQAAAMPEGEDQRKELEKLSQELGKMAAQLKDQLGDQKLNEALSRALEQMDLAKNHDLAKQALDAANQSMNLSQEELKRLGEAFQNLKNIEDTLKNLQTAKQLNEKGQLDGQDAQQAGAQTPQDYERLYKDLMAKAGQDRQNGPPGGPNGQPGDGTEGGTAGNQPGIGRGGTVGEDPNEKTGLKTEKVPSQLTAGKILMEWKENGVGETGQRSDQYQSAVQAVKQGVAEAIRSEQVPPGYHDTIQKYFDRLAEKPAGK